MIRGIGDTLFLTYSQTPKVLEKQLSSGFINISGFDFSIEVDFYFKFKCIFELSSRSPSGPFWVSWNGKTD